MPVTPLLGTTFAELPGGAWHGQRKITFPWEIGARDIYDIFNKYRNRRGSVALPPVPPTVVPTSQQTITGEENVAHDWGHLIRQGVGEFIGIEDPLTSYLSAITPQQSFVAPAEQIVAQSAGTPVTAGSQCDGMSWSGGTPPKGYKVVNYCGQGVLRKIRRRRRRRLMTASDKVDVGYIIGVAGKGQLASSLINRGS